MYILRIMVMNIQNDLKDNQMPLEPLKELQIAFLKIKQNLMVIVMMKSL